MLSFADIRSLDSSEERLSHCVFCGKDLVLLPDDRRQGSCFDCLSLALPAPVPCPECGAEIAGEERAAGCVRCGWYPVGG
jgi:hypothetical protein